VNMMLNAKDVVVLARTLILFVVMVLLSSSSSFATLSDIYCLKTIKNSIEDPYNYLNSSWNFNNSTEGFICKFTGVDCWHPDENKVLNIRLSDMGLKGKFPRGIENCSSLTGLDLSNNKLSGPIPNDISKKLTFVTSLDLSSNSFTGEIPVSLANCTYLNVLKLDHNQLTGAIPLQLGQLNRIKTFSVSNNLLSGPVPVFSSSSNSSSVATTESYVNNLELCGGPLRACQGTPKKSHVGIIAAAAVGGITFTAIIVGIVLYYLSRGVVIKKKEDDPEGNQWAKSIKGTKGIKVSFVFDISISCIHNMLMDFG
jgi:hypothetical protein